VCKSSLFVQKLRYVRALTMGACDKCLVVT